MKNFKSGLSRRSAVQFRRAREASDYFQISESTLWNWVRRPGFPQPIKAGPRVTLFDIEAIEVFLRVESVGMK